RLPHHHVTSHPRNPRLVRQTHFDLLPGRHRDGRGRPPRERERSPPTIRSPAPVPVPDHEEPTGPTGLRSPTTTGCPALAPKRGARPTLSGSDVGRAMTFQRQ